jgi:ABC-type transport system involved in multi-copper enzyme maturation permease subunit
MLRTLIAKEIRNNILSFRFLVSFVLLFAVVTVTALLLTGDYLKKQDEYARRQVEIERYLKSYAHFNRIGNILRPSQPPVPFQTLIRGLTSDVNIEEFDDDPLPVMFPLIDLTFIVTILMSLIALIFSYDAVCGEKEDGTLKLVLANGLSRSKVILAKVVGGVMTLIWPFLLSLTAGMIIILLQPRVAWTGPDWGALGLIVLGSMIYVTVFDLIGVLLSSIHRSSSSSIMTSLFVWVLLVLVVPNLSPYVASFINPAPSRIKIARETERIQDVERDELGRKMVAETKLRVAQDPAYREAHQTAAAEIDKVWAEANRIQAKKADVIARDLRRREEAQTELSVRISMLSPLAGLTYLATDLSSTGVRNLTHFNALSAIWERAFNEDYRPKKIESLRSKDPSADVWNTAVDMSDAPRFRYTEEGLNGRVRSVLPAFAILLASGLVLFAAAYVAFIRYDIR